MIETVWIDSTVNGKIRMNLVTPDSEGSIERAVILLHGKMDPELSAILHDKLVCDVGLQVIADVYKTIVAVPLVNNDYYISSKDFNYKELISHEIPHYLEERFEHLSDYILSGISMGAYGAILNGIDQKFRAILAVSGAFIAHDIVIGNPQIFGSDTPASLPGDHYLRNFMPIETLEDSADRNVEVTIQSMNFEKKYVILVCGKNDEMYTRNIRFASRLDQRGISYSFITIDGAHDNDTFRRGLVTGMSCLFSEKGESAYGQGNE